MIDENCPEEQLALFDAPPSWKEHWQGMPDFYQDDLTSFQKVIVHFRNLTDRKAFAELIGQSISDNTRSLWYPKAEIGRMSDKRFMATEPVNPRYPVYVISKGRADSRLTSKSLERMHVPYRIVIEPQEYDAYAAVIDPAKILVLPFSNLGQGSIPARNWVWEHSISEGEKRHWILDDNIDGFFRLYKNIKTPCTTGAIFRAIEDFTDRYENVGQSGMNYFMFAPRKSVQPPFVLNTRVYSCMLNRNDLPFRWRGRYNEDTDLSLRILKSGLCTILFNAFLCGKSTTMTIKGGNTDELYAGTNKGPKEDDGRWKMAKSLVDQHPDVARIAWKWGRWQHYVNYHPFRHNKLVRIGGEVEEINDYGMFLEVDQPENTEITGERDN